VTKLGSMSNSKAGKPSRDGRRKPLIPSNISAKKGKTEEDHKLWRVLQWRVKDTQSPESHNNSSLYSLEQNIHSQQRPNTRPVLSEPIQQILEYAENHLQETLPWYQTLAEEDKRTLNLVIETAVANFVDWQNEIDIDSDSDDIPKPSTDHIFFMAPLEFTEVVNLRQTLDVMRVIVNLLESNVSAFTQLGHERETHDAILYYAREVAFSAAAIYADTAEMRESWNVRNETFAMDNLINGITDSKVSSQMSILGWPSKYSCLALAGKLKESSQLNSSAIASRMRHKVQFLGGRCLVSNYNDVTIILIDPCTQSTPEEISDALLHFFADDAPLCAGPIRHNVQGAAETIHAALTTYQVAPAATDLVNSVGSIRPLQADDMLPERVLIADQYAADQLYNETYLRLEKGDPHQIMLNTLETFLACGRSLELTANKLSVHSNTVRYRLKRSIEVSGWDPNNPREAFVLQVALKLGRIRQAEVEARHHR
jgi:sugar diacid utilization regulator